MNLDAFVHTLIQANRLKQTARTGWVQRGVPNAEDVAGHSFGVAFTTLLLAQLVDDPVDLGRALSLAVLHDLPEARTTDIPPSVWSYMPDGAKPGAERAAMRDVLGDLPFTKEWLALWQELKTAETVEARLVQDADKLDLFLQALIYEEQSENRHLAEFWQKAVTFHYPISRSLYEALRARRRSGP